MRKQKTKQARTNFSQKSKVHRKFDPKDQFSNQEDDNYFEKKTEASSEASMPFSLNKSIKSDSTAASKVRMQMPVKGEPGYSKIIQQTLSISKNQNLPIIDDKPIQRTSVPTEFIPKAKVLIDHVQIANYKSNKIATMCDYELSKINELRAHLEMQMTTTLFSENQPRINQNFVILETVSFYFALAQQLQNTMVSEQIQADPFRKLLKRKYHVTEASQKIIQHFGQFKSECGYHLIRDINCLVRSIYLIGLSHINRIPIQFLNAYGYAINNQIQALQAGEYYSRSIQPQASQLDKEFIFNILRNEYEALKGKYFHHAPRNAEVRYPPFEMLGDQHTQELGALDQSMRLARFVIMAQFVNTPNMIVLPQGFFFGITHSPMIDHDIVEQVERISKVFGYLESVDTLKKFKFKEIKPQTIDQVKGRWQLASYDKTRPYEVRSDFILTKDEARLAYLYGVIRRVDSIGEFTLVETKNKDKKIDDCIKSIFNKD